MRVCDTIEAVSDVHIDVQVRRWCTLFQSYCFYPFQFDQLLGVPCSARTSSPCPLISFDPLISLSLHGPSCAPHVVLILPILVCTLLCSCGCSLDGRYGASCELMHEMVCPNQCSGHGECDLGFCKCDPGWYGTDCARKMAGLDMEPGVETRVKPGVPSK